MTKTQTPAKLLLRYLWPRMQRGERHFVIDDTQLAFSQTAQQLSKAVRRFNESGHELNWPGFHFSAKVLDVYKLEIKAEREADPAPEGSIPFRRPSGEPMYAFCRGFHATKYKSLIKCWPDDQKSEWISGDFLARVAEFDRRLVEEMEGYEKCLSR